MISTLASWIEVGILVGLLYAPVTIGLAWAFRVLNYPDLTCEGTFIFSGAVSIVALNVTGSLTLSLLVAILAGMLAGAMTAIIHVYLRVSRLLSGIVSWAVLYSVTIRILGGLANQRAQAATLFDALNPTNSRMIELLIAATLALAAIMAGLFLSVIRWGRITKAAGDQLSCVESLGVSPAVVTIVGLGVANGFIGLSGGVLCQHRGVCDVNMGSGLLIAGIAAMVLGEAVYSARCVWQHVLVVVFGTVIYNLAISAFYFRWSSGLEAVFLPSDVRLVSGLLILLPAAIVARRRGRYRLYVSEW